MDHSQMDYSKVGHRANAAMGHEGHDHHAMIADFKKRFYAVLVLTVADGWARNCREEE